jgi:Iap family predicted aminopeptidase
MDKRILAVLVLMSALLVGAAMVKNTPHNPVYLSLPADIDDVDTTQKAIETTTTPTTPTLDDALKSISANQLNEYVVKLTSKEYDGRRSGTPGNAAAAKYIKDTLSEMGLKTEYQKFRFNQRETQNVYAWIEGKNDEIVILGAHYDHLGTGYPGADDNASGTACVMAAAKAYSSLSNGGKPGILDRTVVFQLYSAEEWGLHGSRLYCNYPTFPKNKPSLKKHVFMLNLDMVGYLGKGYYRTTFVHDSAPDVNSIVKKLSVKYPFASSITSKGGGGSDHAPFLNAGIPAAWLHTGQHQYYHKPTDTANRLNYDGMEKISKYAVELTLAIVQTENSPEFNTTGFQTLDYNYDHQLQPMLIP